MKVKTLGVLLLSLSAIFFLTACDKSAEGFSDQQKTQIDEEVHTYLLAHPEVLIDMSNKLQDKMAKEQAAKAKAAIKTNAASIFNNENSPVAGNKEGAVTLVEFFDYQCVHCAEMYPVMQEILKKNTDLKVIYKEFPIFGKDSDYAAAAALAAKMQGKYEQMHDALFASGNIEGKMTAAKVNAIAKKIGLDVVKMKRDMQSAAVKTELQSTRALAETLGLQGTPAFIIAPTRAPTASDDKIAFIPGGTSAQHLQSAIDAAKPASSAPAAAASPATPAVSSASTVVAPIQVTEVKK